MALTAIQQIRLITQDNDPAFPFVSDDEILYFLSVNDENVNRAAIAVCKVILLQLSLRGNETVDIFSIQGSKQAQEFRSSLELFLKSAQLNPVLNTVNGYASGISKLDMATNNANTDANIVCTPLMTSTSVSTFDI